MSKYNLYINDILRTIKLIEETTKNKTQKDIENNINLKDATSMRLQVIGESISKLPKEIKDKNKEVNWKNFENLRNLISHAYFVVNPKILFDIVANELPSLKKGIQKIKRGLNDK